MNNVLLDHLECISDLNFVTVPDFAEHCGLVNARDVLNSYIDAGYVVRIWRQNRGVYSLTEAGKDRLADLKTQRQEASNNNANSSKQPDSGKQSDSKGDAGRNSGSSANQSSKGATTNASGKK